MAGEKEMTTKKILKTVYIPEDHVSFIEKSGESFTEFVRQAVEDRIHIYTGYDGEIEKIRDEINDLEVSLEIKKQKLARLEAKKNYDKYQKEIKDITSLISRALINVDYKSVEDAVEDLYEAKGSLSDEVFRRMVSQLWIERYGTVS
jgi:hypothetical protein